MNNTKIETGKITIEKLIERDGNTCYICGIRTSKEGGCYDPKYPNIEHVHPRSLGGEDAWYNVKVACRDCNVRKNNIPLEEFLKRKNIKKEIKVTLKDSKLTAQQKEEILKLKREKTKIKREMSNLTHEVQKLKPHYNHTIEREMEILQNKLKKYKSFNKEYNRVKMMDRIVKRVADYNTENSWNISFGSVKPINIEDVYEIEDEKYLKVKKEAEHNYKEFHKLKVKNNKNVQEYNKLKEENKKINKENELLKEKLEKYESKGFISKLFNK